MKMKDSVPYFLTITRFWSPPEPDKSSLPTITMVLYELPNISMLQNINFIWDSHIAVWFRENASATNVTYMCYRTEVRDHAGVIPTSICITCHQIVEYWCTISGRDIIAMYYDNTLISVGVTECGIDILRRRCCVSYFVVKWEELATIMC
jgi:hypothetical protein